MKEAVGFRMETLEAGDDEALTEVRHLFDAELGADLYSAQAMRQTAAEPTATVVVARAGEHLAGAAVARIQVPEDIDYYRRFGTAAQRLFTGRRVGSLEALAVLRDRRRQGLGRTLVEARLDWLRARGCDAAVAVSWVSGRPGGSAQLFRSLGFDEGPSVAEFYYEESLRDGWTCPADGNPCRCSAVLFSKLM